MPVAPPLATKGLGAPSFSPSIRSWCSDMRKQQQCSRVPLLGNLIQGAWPLMSLAIAATATVWTVKDNRESGGLFEHRATNRRMLATRACTVFTSIIWGRLM